MSKELEIFTKSIELIQNEQYVDAINEFEIIIKEYPNSELADDAIYNIGLCYFNMNQFETAIKYFEKVIDEYPDATIHSPDKNENGKTAAKCWLGIFNCYFIQNKIDNAKEIITMLKEFDNNSFIVINENKLSYRQIAEQILETV